MKGAREIRLHMGDMLNPKKNPSRESGYGRLNNFFGEPDLYFEPGVAMSSPEIRLSLSQNHCPRTEPTELLPETPCQNDMVSWVMMHRCAKAEVGT